MNQLSMPERLARLEQAFDQFANLLLAIQFLLDRQGLVTEANIRDLMIDIAAARKAGVTPESAITIINQMEQLRKVRLSKT